MEDMDYIIRGKVTNILVECRKEKGVTQKELADAMGSKETTVASWEQGKSLPSIQMLYKLSHKIRSMSDYYADKMNDHIDGIMQKKGEAK